MLIYFDELKTTKYIINKSLKKFIEYDCISKKKLKMKV